MIITHTRLKQIMPNATYDNIMKHMTTISQVQNSEVYQINTVKRMAAFLANLAHESGELGAGRENMNYSRKRLLEVFKKYFTPELANLYTGQPEMIANRVYANRMGNGNEKSGDGYKYRGGGAIQITGKDMYALMNKHIAMPGDNFLVNPDLIVTSPYYVLSAAWYWKERKLNKVMDKPDDYNGYVVGGTSFAAKELTPFEWCCYKVNGGFHGIVQRKAYYNKALQVLA